MKCQQKFLQKNQSISLGIFVNIFYIDTEIVEFISEADALSKTKKKN